MSYDKYMAQAYCRIEELHNCLKTAAKYKDEGNDQALVKLKELRL